MQPRPNVLNVSPIRPSMSPNAPDATASRSLHRTLPCRQHARRAGYRRPHRKRRPSHLIAAPAWPLAVNAIAAAIMAIAFTWRRRAPLLFVVARAAIPLSSGLTSAHATLVGFYCVTVPMFTAAAWQPRSRAFAGLAYWVVGSVGVAVAGHESAAGFAGGLVLSCLLWAAGRLSRSQRLLAERVAENHPLLIAEREEPERLAIASERARIAREDRRCRARLGRGPPRRCRGRLRAPLG